MNTIKKYLPHLIFLSFLLILIFSTYRDYGVSWDEKVFLNVGKFYTVKLFEVLNIPTNLSYGAFAPTWFHMQGHGVFFDILVIITSLFFPLFNFETFHLIHSLFAVPIFILVGMIVGRLINRQIGFIAMILLFLFPRFYGDIFNNPIDIPTALFFALAVLSFLIFIKSRQTLLSQIIFGVVMGLTINQRLILIYLIPLNFIFLALFKAGGATGLPAGKAGGGPEKRSFTNIFGAREWRNLLINYVTILVTTIITMHLTHPYLLKHPVKGLFDMLAFSRQYLWTAAVLYNGTHVLGSELPWHYLPTSMLITIPESIIFLFGVGTIYLIKNIYNKTKSGTERILALYLLLLIPIPLIINFILHPILYDVWRHFLFLTIPIIIIASFGIKAILEIKNKTIIILILSFISLNLILVGREMIRLHPYQYIYFNSLTGGLKGAYTKHETDYWGLSYKEATEWFIKNINDGKTVYKIKTEGDPLSSTAYFTKNMRLTGNPAEADYIFSFTRWNLHTQYPGKVVYSVKRQGVPLVFIIKK